MIECTACGFANSLDSKYCAQCGVRLTPHTGETTNIIQIIDDEGTRAEIDIDDALVALAPGTALLVLTRGQDPGVRYLLDQPETTAGRSSTCDILLDDITVSRKHVTFSLQDGIVILTDHGSLNGTYVNRDLIDGPTVLKRGDEIQIGKFRMVLLVSERGSV